MLINQRIWIFKKMLVLFFYKKTKHYEVECGRIGQYVGYRRNGFSHIVFHPIKTKFKVSIFLDHLQFFLHMSGFEPVFLPLKTIPSSLPNHESNSYFHLYLSTLLLYILVFCKVGLIYIATIIMFLSCTCVNTCIKLQFQFMVVIKC